jgi:hypothetical protein
MEPTFDDLKARVEALENELAESTGLPPSRMSVFALQQWTTNILLLAIFFAILIHGYRMPRFQATADRSLALDTKTGQVCVGVALPNLKDFPVPKCQDLK